MSGFFSPTKWDQSPVLCPLNFSTTCDIEGLGFQIPRRAPLALFQAVLPAIKIRGLFLAAYVNRDPFSFTIFSGGGVVILIMQSLCFNAILHQIFSQWCP